MAAQSEIERFSWTNAVRAAIRVEKYLLKCGELLADPLIPVGRALVDELADTLTVSGQTLSLSKVNALAFALLDAPHIKCVSVTDAGMSDAFGPLLGEILAEKEFHTLSLSHNRLTGLGVEEMMHGLFLNVFLTRLDLSHNLIRCNGAKVVADFVKASSTLRECDLSYNRIEAKGAEALAGALTSSLSLVTLDLSFNRLEDKGAEAIGRGVGASKSLTSLSLGGNGISEGISAFAEHLKDNHSLRKLELFSNEIDKAGSRALILAVSKHENLRTLDLGCNHAMNAESISELAEALHSTFEVSKLVIRRDLPL